MNILLNNNALATRTGSELYAKEVAEGLIKRGDTVAVFSTSLGGLAKLMNESGIQATDNLSELSWVPDIIHGQHHLETMITLAHFPNVPAIYICHGWRNWQADPPFHPRIMEYAAVDTLTLDNAVKKHNISVDKIRLMHNFVDLVRFEQRLPLPDRPKKALVFNNSAGANTYLSLVRHACARANIELEVIGSVSWHGTDRPENLLKEYDLVFAVGRSAFEALATGAAVIICNDYGVGPMVKLKDLDDLYDKNFGVAAMNSKLDTDIIYREICNYNAEDSALLTRRLRDIVGIEAAVDKLKKFYMEVIEKYKKVSIDPIIESRSVAAYLKNISIFLKKIDADLYYKNQELCSIYDNEIKLKSSKIWKFREKYIFLKNRIFNLSRV